MGTPPEVEGTTFLLKLMSNQCSYLVLGWLYSALRCVCAVVSVTTPGVVVATPIAVLLVPLHRSSGPGAGMESTEQILEREEISLWLESDRLSAFPAGRKV